MDLRFRVEGCSAKHDVSREPIQEGFVVCELFDVVCVFFYRGFCEVILSEDYFVFYVFFDCECVLDLEDLLE